MQPLFAVDAASTAWEEFDGETVVIQFKKGTYSVLSGSGPQLFSMLHEPASVDAIARSVAEMTGGGFDEICREVGSFVEALVSKEIVVGAGTGTGAPAVAFAGAFVAPGVETFEDLADMMLVDPVHEVDVAEGWPRRPL